MGESGPGYERGRGGECRPGWGMCPCRLPPVSPQILEYYMFFFAWSLIAQKVRRAEAPGAAAGVSRAPVQAG